MAKQYDLIDRASSKFVSYNVIVYPFSSKLYIIRASGILNMRDQLMVDDDRDDAVLGEEPSDVRVYLVRPQFVAGEEPSAVDVH
jgi:hypothetical protein